MCNDGFQNLFKVEFLGNIIWGDLKTLESYDKELEFEYLEYFPIEE